MAATATQSEAAPQDISTLLETITSCLSGTGSSLPKAAKDEPTDASIDPPQEGISLLNTKSELLLSYLHNLVFLTIFQLRGLSSEDSAEEENQSLQEDVVKKLTELRVYLERGVRPLEGRLKYQVDKVVKAAEDAERDGRNAPGPTKSKTKKAPKSDEDESGSEEASSGSEDEESEDEEDIDEMAYRPNVSAFSQGVEAQAKPTKSDITEQKAPSDGIYRPPKIMPTALPTTERREREDRRPRRSNVIDEFVNAEMSSAPTMEASIGSAIRSGGRHTRSQKEKDHEEERRAYEETNFVRLPKLSKEEQKKQRGRRGPESTFGGEDWKGLTEGADRIARLTQRGKGSGSALDKSRKRKTTEDMPRGDGAVGQIFDKRRKKVDSWKR
ncbi:hypothetical protein SI65_00013 [Aspergillus cristatus]|uniref:Uncharacterized protein n=1 Tax=Aspergillus cristatus TaxID=573508 RepID=A0A1E3BN90_ASPCR|nr:hypothetical protein SI65_00013 [Aspergillus cristatus]